MRRINKESKLNILILLFFLFVILLSILTNNTYGIVVISILLIFDLIEIYKSIKNNKFFLEKINQDSYVFSEVNLNLIGIKLYEKIERENKLFDDKLRKLSFFYDDLEQINREIIPELEKILLFKKFFSRIFCENRTYISFLAENLLFLIYLKEKEFEEAYLNLKSLVAFSPKYKNSRYYEKRDLFNQTIEKVLILVYLLEYKDNEYVQQIISLLIKLNKGMGRAYLENLGLSEEDINYCLERMRSK